LSPFSSRKRATKDTSNIVTIAHNVIQKWNFSWLDLTKETFKFKINEMTKSQQNPFNDELPLTPTFKGDLFAKRFFPPGRAVV